MNVFLLEDDDAIGMGLKYSLEKEGFTVTHAKSLAQARADFKKDKYSICECSKQLRKKDWSWCEI